jgi:hypothetical protein
MTVSADLAHVRNGEAFPRLARGSGNLSARCVLAVMIGAQGGWVSERKLHRESSPIANGA